MWELRGERETVFGFTEAGPELPISEFLQDPSVFTHPRLSLFHIGPTSSQQGRVGEKKVNKASLA